MKATPVKMGKGYCIEVFCDEPGPMLGETLGYIMRTIAGWDAWRMSHPGGKIMEKVGCNLRTPSMAMNAITNE